MSSENNVSPKTVDNLQRRTLIKGAAWAAPVIAVAATAPMAAASTPDNPTPVPATTTNTFFTGTSVSDVENAGEKVAVVVNDDEFEGFVYFTVRRDGSVVPAGSYYLASNLLTYTFTWNAAQSLTLSETGLRNWTRVTGDLAGTTGSVTYSYPLQLANGADNQIGLPKLTLSATDGGAIGTGSVQGTVTGTNIPSKNSGGDI